MALTEIYVDPSIAADSGAGTLGDPYGDLEYAIEQETFDTTNGTRVNIKAGTDEVLAADLGDALADTSVSVAWAPSSGAPLVFQGYTSAAGDGGIGGISGGGSVAIITAATLDYISFVDLHLHNTGAVLLAQVDDFCSFIGCEIDTTTERGLFLGLNGLVDSCYFHTISGVSAVVSSNGSLVRHCQFDMAGDGGMTSCVIDISGAGLGSSALRNIISIDGTQRGIKIGDGGQADYNSIYCNGGSGIGIQVNNANDAISASNNLIEGFSSGTGIYIGAANISCRIVRGNSFYNCATEIDDASAEFPPIIKADNETLSASPFTSASTGDFSPVDTGNVKEGALPQVIGGGLV